MTFRTRLLLTLAILAIIPVSLFGFQARRELHERLTAQFEARVAAMTAVVESDLTRASVEVKEQLAGLGRVLAEDNRFRRGVLQGDHAERTYLLDFATRAMAQMGLDMLQIQDEEGRILSSGHFRNAYDRVDPVLPLLTRAPGGTALIEARTAERNFTALATADSLRLGARRFTLIGGLAVDDVFLARLSRPPDATIALVLSKEAPAPPSTLTRVVPFPLVTGDRLGTASFVITHSGEPLMALRRSLDRWLLVTLLAASLAVLLAAAWLAARLSKPLRDLAARTEALDVDRLILDVDTERADEIGALARGLTDLTRRLRAGTLRLRDAERRAAVGDVARQVNHDIKNGLTPLRQVVRHLGQVAESEPERLGAVFQERNATLQSGIGYLEDLAARYARMTPERVQTPCRLSEIVAQAAMAAGDPRVAVEDDGADVLMSADPVALRRIVENLVRNAVESLDGEGGHVTVRLERRRDTSWARILVDDTGPGIPAAARERVFEDFYTTKTQGTGLGLSIVRRLVGDLGGTVRVEDPPHRGARFVVELPLEERA